MRYIKPLGIILPLVIGLFSCGEPLSNELETTPYFDLKGFIAESIQEVDGVDVSKVSQIQEEKNAVEVIYTSKDWEEELAIFTDADINTSSLVQAYKTTSSDTELVHELLPKAKGKVKYIKVIFLAGEVSSVSVKIADDNLFYTTSTLAEITMNDETKRIDHYTIETSQKIWFLDANFMKIQGSIVP
jgi:hypothetical protein